MALGMAIASLATTGISSGISFAQGIKQRKLAKEAEREAGIAFAKAMKLLDVNAFENMSVNKQDIALARTSIDTRSQAMLQQAAEAGVRGIASVAGVMGQNQIQSELSLLADSSSREQARQEKILTQDQANIDAQAAMREAEATGAQGAAANLEDISQQSFKSGADALTSFATSALSIPKLYPDDGGIWGEKIKSDKVEKTVETEANTGSAVDPSKTVEINEPISEPLGGDGQEGLKSTPSGGIGKVFSDKSLGSGFEYMKNADGTYSFKKGAGGNFKVIDPSNPEFAPSIEKLDLYFNKTF